MDKDVFGKVKSYPIIDTEKFISLLDKFIDRSNRWIDDATERQDSLDISYYKGQKDVIEELKDMISRFK